MLQPALLVALCQKPRMLGAAFFIGVQLTNCSIPSRGVVITVQGLRSTATLCKGIVLGSVGLKPTSHRPKLNLRGGSLSRDLTGRRPGLN